MFSDVIIGWNYGELKQCAEMRANWTPCQPQICCKVEFLQNNQKNVSYSLRCYLHSVLVMFHSFYRLDFISVFICLNVVEMRYFVSAIPAYIQGGPKKYATMTNRH